MFLKYAIDMHCIISEMANDGDYYKVDHFFFVRWKYIGWMQESRSVCDILKHPCRWQRRMQVVVNTTKLYLNFRNMHFQKLVKNIETKFEIQHWFKSQYTRTT